MLRVENVSVAYGRITGLREVSLTVNDGEIVTIMGANGAGKSSLLNAIFGVVPLKSGSIWLDSHQITGLASHSTVRLGLALYSRRKRALRSHVGEGQPDHGCLLPVCPQPAEHSGVYRMVPASPCLSVHSGNGLPAFPRTQ